jgi:hypothetical protein
LIENGVKDIRILEGKQNIFNLWHCRLSRQWWWRCKSFGIWCWLGLPWKYWQHASLKRQYYKPFYITLCCRRPETCFWSVEILAFWNTMFQQLINSLHFKV